MGKAKRRKGFDPNWGKSESKSRFTAKVQELQEDQIVLAKITDSRHSREAVIRFKITKQNNKMYAHAMIDRSEVDATKWVGESINEISPIVCRAILKYADVVVEI